MKSSHDHKDVRCDVCGEEFWCVDGFSCHSRVCDYCGEKMNELQPAARDLIEILLHRIVKLERKR